MRFNLPSLFLSVTIAVLLVALYAERQDPDVLRIGDYVDTWVMEKSIAGNSKWSDKDSPPDLTCTEAYSIGSSICGKLDRKVGTTGVRDWEVAAVSLERAQFIGGEHWMYILRLEAYNFPGDPSLREPKRLALMVLMDRTVVFDFESCSDDLSQAVKESLTPTGIAESAG